MSSSEIDPRDPTGLPLDDLEVLFENTFNELAEKGEKLSQKNHQNMGQNTPIFDANSESLKITNSTMGLETGSEKAPLGSLKFKDNSKAKTSLRMKYEAEVSAFKKREGDLEDIRRSLGLSKRKICQLLMVDPSAWTRWTKKDAEAPPHIYRALEWYLLLQEKHPEYKSSLWLNAVARPSLTKQELDSIKQELIQGSQSELTKKALFYLKEEDLKRENLSSSFQSKMAEIKLHKRIIYGLIVMQIISLIVLVFK